MTTEGTEWPDREVACRQCRGRTAHRVLHEVALSGDNELLRWWEEYRLVECNGCKTITFVRTSRDTEQRDEDGDLWEEVETYPNPNARSPMEGDEELPWAVASIYHETLAAHDSNLPILATMGIRALVESICIEQGAKKYRLEHKIDELVENGTWLQSYHDALDEIRFLGNDAAHRLAAVSTKELLQALGAVEHVMRVVYVLPAQTENLKQRRDKREAKKKR